MKYLTLKDIEVLNIIKKFNGETKSNIARNSKYIYTGLNHTLAKLKGEHLINIEKETRTKVTITPKGEEVLNRQ